MMSTALKKNALKSSVFAVALTAIHLSAAFAVDDGTQLIVQESLFATREPLNLQAPIMGTDSLASLVPNRVTKRADETSNVIDDNVNNRYSDADLSALYYYAKQRQHSRVDAEIARLQVIHPGFIAPADLYVTAQKLVPNEQPLWDMFAVDDFTGIDAELVRRKTEDPKWQSTEDFSSKLARKKQRIQMVELARVEDWIGVVSVGQSIDPKVESDVDLVWTLIDAYSHLGEKAPIVRAYRGLFFREPQNRLSDEHLLVTLQKAVRDFPAVEIRRVMTSLWTVPSQVPGIENLQIDLVRKGIADFNASESDVSTISSYDIKTLTNLAISNENTSDLSLLGWYQLKLNQPIFAQPLFEKVMQIEANSENAKGMYLSLSRQDLDHKAYEFARTNLPNLADGPIFLMNVLSPKFAKPKRGSITEEILIAYTTAILETSSANHSEVLGWYAYNSRQFDAAYAWFSKAVEWDESEDRLKGLALTLLRLGKKNDYVDLKDQYVDLYPGIWTEVARARPPKARKAVSVSRPKKNVKTSYIRHFERKDYKSCLQEIDRLSTKGLTANAWLIRGWCYLAMSRVNEAQNSFAQAMTGSGKVKTDAVYGRALALLRVRLTDDAESLLLTHPLATKRQNELLSEIYYQRARSSFDVKQYDRTLAALNARADIISEPRDLTLMRGWAYHHLGYPNEANTIFRRLNMHLRDGHASRGIVMTGPARGG